MSRTQNPRLSEYFRPGIATQYEVLPGPGHLDYKDACGSDDRGDLLTGFQETFGCPIASNTPKDWLPYRKQFEAQFQRGKTCLERRINRLRKYPARNEEEREERRRHMYPIRAAYAITKDCLRKSTKDDFAQNVFQSSVNNLLSNVSSVQPDIIDGPGYGVGSPANIEQSIREYNSGDQLPALIAPHPLEADSAGWKTILRQRRLLDVPIDRINPENAFQYEELGRELFPANDSNNNNEAEAAGGSGARAGAAAATTVRASVSRKSKGKKKKGSKPATAAAAAGAAVEDGAGYFANAKTASLNSIIMEMKDAITKIHKFSFLPLIENRKELENAIASFEKSLGSLIKENFDLIKYTQENDVYFDLEIIKPDSSQPIEAIDKSIEMAKHIIEYYQQTNETGIKDLKQFQLTFRPRSSLDEKIKQIKIKELEDKISFIQSRIYFALEILKELQHLYIKKIEYFIESLNFSADLFDLQIKKSKEYSSENDYFRSLLFNPEILKNELYFLFLCILFIITKTTKKMFYREHYKPFLRESDIGNKEAIEKAIRDSPVSKTASMLLPVAHSLAKRNGSEHNHRTFFAGQGMLTKAAGASAAGASAAGASAAGARAAGGSGAAGEGRRRRNTRKDRRFAQRRNATRRNLY